MNDQQNISATHMQIDNYAVGENSSNVVNNYLASPSQASVSFPNLPNQVLEALSIAKKFLARQKETHEITITKNEVKVNGKLIYVNYEACKICKNQHGNLTCPKCQRKICSNCITKRSRAQQCLRCKGSEKIKDKLNSEFENKIERLLRMGNEDRTQEVILVEIENLGGKNLEELIEVVKGLEKKGDKLNRQISLAYFYIGKVFYERMEDFFSESDLDGKEKLRKILGSFKHAKDLDFGGEKMSIREIKEKLGVDDSKVSRFFGLTSKVYLTYQVFDSAEEQIRKAEHILSSVWLRDLSQEKFIDFLGKLEQRKEEELVKE
ncbi:10378_t:CDS:1 [Funneliformis geosporum]|uniref:10378_t:CDS:1 n=1 Tax=Funneliformis geosporum TaxID=1117311 RepID=A0A9W4T1S7_9GLOM|nr:10378_t:CDS:1 [Funneliformis geosporum]